MKRALLVGINDYPRSPLKGCVSDALLMQEVLSTHENGDRNFDCTRLISSEKQVTRTRLRAYIKKLFNQGEETALLYFSGHGASTDIGTSLATQDGQANDEGVSLMEIVTIANNSLAKEVIIILDCCYAGDAGNTLDLGRKAILREGVSILAAARDTQYSVERKGKGVLTGIVYDAMIGGASNVIGEVNLSGIYYYADTMLNAWEQRPIFKSHISHMIPLRKCKPKIPSETLRKLPIYFPGETKGIILSPDYERSIDGKNKDLPSVMDDLYLYYANGLLVTVDTNSLHQAATQSKSCVLSPLGNYYKQLAIKGQL